MSMVDTWTRPWPTALTGIGVAVVLVAGLVSVAVVSTGGARYPDAWDPRIADLADFVEQERRLDFDHPVFVDFLDEEAFRQKVVAGEEDLTVEDRADLDQGARLLRATGLVRGSFDLLESSNELTGEGVVAYYDPVEERITVRGTELTTGVRATLVHELTHALQDQRFDLSRLGQLPTDSANNAFRGVIEGDALRVERAWAALLTPTEREVLVAEQASELPGAGIPGVPGALTAFFSAPYLLGGPFTEVVFSEQGQAGLDQAFQQPPATEEHLLDPFTYLEDEGRLPVDPPVPAGGAPVLEAGDFGALTWFIVLAEHIDPRQALTAVDGWGGDAYVVFERDGRSCLRSAFRGDTEAENEEMRAALGAWATEAPATDATVTPGAPGAGVVVLESCDPGPEASAPGGGAEDALAYPVSRTYLTLGARAAGVATDRARCIGNAFVQALAVEELLAIDSVLADPQALADQSQRAAQACP